MKLSFLQSRRTGLSRTMAVLLCLLTISPESIVAQNPQLEAATPLIKDSSGEVSKVGYLLKPTGLSTADWPKLRLDFSIERPDRTKFQNLRMADVELRVDGRAVSITQGKLTSRDNESSSVLLLLDGSGSMSSTKLDKLRAAKRALKTLINNLEPTDRVQLVVFDEEPRTLVPVTVDRELLQREMVEFNIRKGHSRFTRLYDAVDFALREAHQNQIGNILLISDGWEDTPETRKLLSSPANLEAFKQEREQAITQFSRSNDIRIFTVAIGNERGTGLNYVDRTALANIARGANGGSGVYIELNPTALDDALKEGDLLARLQETLNSLRHSFRYSYSLTLDLGETVPRDGREHKLWFGFTVGEEPRIQLPVEITYSWTTADGPPVVKVMKLQPAIFIQSPSRNLSLVHLVVIYFGLLSVLLVLAVVPAIGRRLVGGRMKINAGRAITTVGRKSQLVGNACPNEGINSGRAYLIREGDVVLICPRCKTGHHLSCWSFNEHHCMNRTCEYEMVVPTNVLQKYGLRP